MVLRKRSSDNALNGHHLPTIPRAPRSIRKRGLPHRTQEGGRICPFELLAAVAGKLLEESDCSSASSSAVVGFDQCGIGKDAIKKEPQHVDKQMGREHHEQGSAEGSVFLSELQRDICKGKLKTVDEAIDDHASVFASSACSVKAHSDSKSLIQKSECEFVKQADNIRQNSPKCGQSDDIIVDKEINVPLDTNGKTSGDFIMNNKFPASANFEENVELPLYRDSSCNDSFIKLGNDVKIGGKDDDKILSHDSQPNSKMTAHNSPTRIGDRKLRKLSTSNYWKTAPKLKDYEHSNTGGPVKHFYHRRRYSYGLERPQRNTLFKKRKLFDRSSAVTYDGGISCESVSNSPGNSIEDEKNASTEKLHEGNRLSSSAFGHQKFCNLRNSVRLSIKSFEVPELFIEVPQSTTFGSLKKTVLETLTTILGGLRVGVLLHGEKIRDDTKTLLQTGISQNDKIDSIGFMLEPDSPTQPSQPMCSEDPPIPLSIDLPKFVNRSQVNPNEEMFLLDTPDKLSVTDSNSPAGSSGDLLPFPATERAGNDGPESKAIVPVPEASIEALAVAPVEQRPKCSEIGQRRTRRPFSVSEVEALVQAVEKLGTGRWRDVKLCAFENAKHRTYVDLKDKWKTLAHTARISPQQRRGEPVPQELLDRVLVAQAYWSEHQTKQHGKQQQTTIPKLTNLPGVKA